MEDLRVVVTQARRTITVAVKDADGYLAEDAVIRLQVDGKDRGRADNSEGRAKFEIEADAANVELFADYPGQETVVDKLPAESNDRTIVFRNLHVRPQEGFLERHLPAIIGVAFVLIAIVLSFVFTNQNALQTHIILVVLSVGGGGVASEIPGLLDVKLSLSQKATIAASGALALFVILFFAVPAGTPQVK